jgi:predicted transposase YdaD
MEEPREQSNVTASTAILAGLVLDKKVIERVLRQEIMRESVIYQDIRDEAKAEGREEGQREEGVAFVLRLLRKRFGQVSLDVEKRIQGLSVSQLEDLGEALLDFNTQADLVDWLNRLP